MTSQTTIPQEKSEAVTRSLREAFGVDRFEDIRRITVGPASNPVFRIVVRGTPYLLRINTRAGDLARHYDCMRAAAETGLTPRVWYTNVEDRVSIVDFVEAAPFPAAEALVRMPGVLRRLHALPPFPGIPDHINTTCTFLLNKGPAVDGLLQKIQASNLFPKDAEAELFARYEQIAAVYPHRDADRVSSHNDLFKPDNMLFDGERVWLVDWEAAFRNDRYADLAVTANMLVTSETDEIAFLREYFGEPPDEYQRARLFLAQQLSHIFYAMGFLMIGSAGQPVDWSDSVPEYGDFQRRFWAGEVSLTDGPTKIRYAKSHWERLRENARQARFNEALRIVAEGPPMRQ